LAPRRPDERGKTQEIRFVTRSSGAGGAGPEKR